MSRQSSTSTVAAGADMRALASIMLNYAQSVVRAETETTRTQRNALVAFAVRVAIAGLLYISQIVLARWMGGFEYGIYVFVWTWVLVLGGLAHLGLNLAMIRLLPEYLERSELPLLRGLMLGGRLASLGLGTILALLGMAALWPLSPYLESHYVLPLYLALVCVPMFSLSDTQDGLGRGRAWLSIALFPPYILRPLLLLMAMAAAHFAGLSMKATTAAGAAIFATWVATLVQTVLINRRAAGEIPPGERQYAFGIWFRTALPLLLVVAADLVLQNTDILVISRYLGPTDVGIYFAAAKTMSLIMFVHYAVGSAVANRFAALNARGDKEGLRSFVRDAVNWTFWPSLLCAAIILSLGKPLLWLFGPQFTDGYPVMFILVVGFLFRSAMGPAEFLLNMLGEQVLCASVLMTTAIMNIALNFALVPAFGLMGAASATALSLVMAALMNYVVARRRLDIEIGIWKNLRKS